MVATFDFKLEGLEEIKRRARALGQDGNKKAANSATRAAQVVVRDKARASASGVDDITTRENIAKNITIKKDGKFERRTGDIKYKVGVLGGAKTYANNSQNRRRRRAGQTYTVGGDKGNPGGDTFYWRFLEFGTRNHGRKLYLREAQRQTVGDQFAAFTRAYDKAITRFINKGYRK